jgi:hypothetical protein
MRAFRGWLRLSLGIGRLALLGGLVVFASRSSAEYRAFLLQITDSRSGSERLVFSTLDELQYRDYYHLHPAESLQRLDTWMCWARSDHGQPICPNPRTLSPEAAASATGATPPTPTQGPESARPTSGDSLPAPPQL